jgi:hypothetical protein
MGSSIFFDFCLMNIGQSYVLSKPSAQGYNWATLFLGSINTGTWPSRFGKPDETAKYGREFYRTLT